MIAGMSDADIVWFVTTDGTNKADNDQREEDDMQGPAVARYTAVAGSRAKGEECARLFGVLS